MHCTWQICFLLVLYFVSSIVFYAFCFVFYNLSAFIHVAVLEFACTFDMLLNIYLLAYILSTKIE